MFQEYTIPAEDALRLKGHQLVTEANAAKELYEKIIQRETSHFMAIAALYHSAYIAGVRHERARRINGGGKRNA